MIISIKILMNLPQETWSIIISFLKKNHRKFNLLVTCTRMSRCDFTFDQAIDCRKIMNSRWLNRFTNIEVINTSVETKLLPKIKKISLGWDCELNCRENSNHWFKRHVEESFNDLPTSVTHLHFFHRENDSIEKYNKLNSLSFIMHYDNGMLNETITSPVTHLKFSVRFLDVTKSHSFNRNEFMEKFDKNSEYRVIFHFLLKVKY